MTIRAIYQEGPTQNPSQVTPEDFSQILAGQRGCLWVDFQDGDREQVESILRESFGFHPLAIEDALHQTHIPKIDSWDDYIYVVVHSLGFISDLDTLLFTEIDVFVGDRYLVTYQEAPSDAVDRVWDTVAKSKSILPKGPAHILFRIIDEAEVGFGHLIDRIEEKIDQIEDELFANPSQDVLAKIFGLKRTILAIRRITSPLSDVIGKLARGGFDQFSVEERMYFHDVYDHMIRLGDMLENLRDIVNGTLEIHLSAASNRLNDVLKTLTIITTLFMPLTFISGFFGMNFFQATGYLGPWTTKAVLMITIGLMVVTPLFMYLWIRRRFRI